jgi:hypothetical protein
MAHSTASGNGEHAQTPRHVPHLCGLSDMEGRPLCLACQAQVVGSQSSDNSPPTGCTTQRGQRGQRGQRAQKAQSSQTLPPPEQSAPSALSVWHTSQGGITESVRRMVFRLCRRLKGEGRQADESLLREYFRANMKALTGLPWDEFRLLVMEGLDKVKSPLGTGPLHDALTEADNLPPPISASRYVIPAIKRVVGLCAVLQKRKGKDPFPLASNPLADELGGIDPSTVARWLRLLVRDGVLELKGEKGHSGRASEYHFRPAFAERLASGDDDGPYRDGF